MNLLIWLAVALATLLLAAAFAGRAFLRIEWIQLQVRRKFPQVTQVSGNELERRLKAGEPVVLVDVRRPDEFAVSHLAGARWLDPREEAPHLPGVGRDAAVVTYCSVGWRSSQMAARLQQAGYHRAANLEGSIFKWAREGRPLFQGDTLQGEKPVAKVHPYSQYWSFLVPSEKRAYRPEEALPPERP